MISLRLKFTLALLGTSLAALLTVGLVSHWLLYREFSQLALERSFSNFQADVKAYYEEYGSWDAGREVEPFPDFARRRHNPHFAPNHDSPPPEDGAPAGPPPEKHAGPGENGPPPPGGIRGRVPFRFLLLDPGGNVIAGDPAYAHGQSIPASLRATAEPVVVNGKLAAWAVPLKNPNLLAEDHAYMDAIEQSLAIGSVIALGLTLLLATLFGSRLGHRLRQLTRAAFAISEGQLRQRVPVVTRDEIGQLAEAFNKMSGDLERAHEELKRSGERIQHQAEQLREQSIRDGLTGLYNRRALHERGLELYAQAERYHQPLCVMICDIDHFKRINDTFSHAVGDQVIKEVARLLKEHTRVSDVVARYGGEEFVVLLPNTPHHQAVHGCDGLRRLVEEHNWSAIHPDLRVTLSGGISQASCSSGFESMIAGADGYLYEAKRGGRNQLCYFGSSVLHEPQLALAPG
jgi:two-component system cell cycle response regulator